MKITKRYLRKIGACYEDKELKELWGNAFGKRRSVTPLEFAKCNHPKKEDLLWVLLRKDIIPETELHELACKFAETALLAERKAGHEPHPSSWVAIETKRRWLRGEATDEELAAAWMAARAAARAAAWGAARAAWAASEAAWAREAAREAAWMAAMAAASRAVSVEQLAMVIDVMKGGSNGRTQRNRKTTP